MEESPKAIVGGRRLEILLPPKKEKVVIPHFFRCPISLDLMRDPVSLCTGVSYDRSSIEKWLNDGNNTCPATMQVLGNHDLIPNHTLRRLIQEWCVANALQGVERIPTPKQPAEPQQVQALLRDVHDKFLRLETLRVVRSLARESERNRNYLLDGGVISTLASVLTDRNVNGEETEIDEPPDVCEEALGLLLEFSHSEQVRALTAEPHLLARICWFLSRGALESQIQAANIIEHFCTLDEDVRMKVGTMDGVMKGLLSLLSREELNLRGVHASLACLQALCSPRRVRARAIEAGAVPSLIGLLREADRGITESVLANLELMCMCADGRAAVTKLSKAIPTIVNLLLRVSSTATERAVGVLWSVCHYSPEKRILRASVQAGLFSKLFLLVQSECRQTTKRQASELLKLLRATWEQFPYISNEHGLTHIMAS